MKEKQFNDFESESMDFFSAGKEARHVSGHDEKGEMENRPTGTRNRGPSGRYEGRRDKSHRQKKQDHRESSSRAERSARTESRPAAEPDPMEFTVSAAAPIPEEDSPVPVSAKVSVPEPKPEEIPVPVSAAVSVPEPEPEEAPAFEFDPDAAPEPVPVKAFEAVPEPEEIPAPAVEEIRAVEPEPVDIPMPAVEEIRAAEPEPVDIPMPAVEEIRAAEPEPVDIPTPAVEEIRAAEPEPERASAPAKQQPDMVLIPEKDFKSSFRVDRRSAEADDMSDLAAILMEGAVPFAAEPSAASSAENTAEDPLADLRAALIGAEEPDEAFLQQFAKAQKPAAPAPAQPTKPVQPAKPAPVQQPAQPAQPAAAEQPAEPKAAPAQKPAPARKPVRAEQEKPPVSAYVTDDDEDEEDYDDVPPKKRRRGGLIAAIVAAVLCLAVAACAFVVSQRQTIFPNVTLHGTDLSDLTVSEAANTVKSTGWDGSNGAILEVLLPGEQTMEVRGRDVGWNLTAEEAAEAAWNYGRDGNFLTNLVTFVRASLSGHELADDLLPEPDTTILRKQVKRAVDKANLALSNGSMDLDLDAKVLRLVKGGDLFLVETEDVYNRILSALEANESKLDCVKQVDADSEVKDVDLQAIHDEVCGEPENAYYDTEKKEVVDGKPGVEFDVDEARKLWDRADAGDVVEIPLTLKEADFRKSDVTQLYADKLATKTTSLSGSSAARIMNITLAAEKINGVTLDPGQSFSYNNTVGQRTTARGFREAGAYSNGEVVQEVGGGICQVSSTLYYTAMIANLKITARTNHYFSVGYIEPGMDATVSWGAPDFRFENDRTFPIKIVATVTGNNVTVEIWGTDVDHSTVRMDSTTSGMTTTTYRNVYDKDGQLISRTQEAVSTYHTHDEARPTAVPVRTPTPTRTPTNTPTPAAPTPTPAAPTPTPAAPTPTPAAPTPTPTPEIDTIDDAIVG